MSLYRMVDDAMCTRGENRCTFDVLREIWPNCRPFESPTEFTSLIDTYLYRPEEVVHVRGINDYWQSGPQWYLIWIIQSH